MTSTGGRPADRLRWVAEDEEVSRCVGEFFEAWSEPHGIHGEFRPLGPWETYFKAEPMAGRARLRHGLRRAFLGRPYPRLAEFENLRWLGQQGFAVARPLAAGVRHVWNGIDWQFLFTERFTDAEPWMPREGALPEERTLELAKEVARMHDLGFIHRDLHLRNLAWRRTAKPHVLFYDAWRGGARLQSRGVSYDLECLSRGLASEGKPADVQRFLGAYLEARQVRKGLRRVEAQLDRFTRAPRP